MAAYSCGVKAVVEAIRPLWFSLTEGHSKLILPLVPPFIGEGIIFFKIVVEDYQYSKIYKGVIIF
ncbi:hypothetical protein PanWU01x14_304420 [Parasponia andersonii]|uniref:Uncharacterized protein n=1 Tax=Parasponia andersonii TaxID=3476 RepID=A0A2P5AST6_PARAD|nr:hypothetical protein PanWU01x14_304420 [Parasponia andersonii]